MHFKKRGFFIIEKCVDLRYITEVQKLLFITQKIDKEDDVLGVYHEWVKRLAGKVAKLNVICLYKGTVDLSSNVGVFSLGKETGLSNLKYLRNFYKYIFQLRNEYDLVFVHMNPAYIWLGWLFWRLWGKKIVYWNASYKVNWFMRAALALSDKGVTSVSEAFVNSEKVVAVGQGIDTNLFRKDESVPREPNSVLYLGRISPVKNIDILLDAVKLLHSQGKVIKLLVVGAPNPADTGYFERLKAKAADLKADGVVKFLGRVPHYETPIFFNSHKVFVNLTESRSFDKSILEAMACKSLILVSNSVYKRILGPELSQLLMFPERNAVILAAKLEKLLNLPCSESDWIGEALRQIVVRDHDLNSLADKLIRFFNSA